MSRVAALLSLAVAMIACRSGEAAKPPAVPRDILAVATAALDAAASVHASGDIGAALRRPGADLYADAMRPHFAMMQKMHDAARDAGIAYPRYAIEVRPERYCANATTARLHLVATVRYDMASRAGAPPYTSGAEEHVFRLVRHGERWRIAEHHEITLEELHDPEAMARLRDCDPERVIVDESARRNRSHAAPWS